MEKVIKNQKKVSYVKNVPILLIVIVISYLSAQSRIGGYLSFVNVMIASLSGIWGVFSFISSMISYISCECVSEGFVQLGAMVIILGVKLLTNKKEKPLSDGLLVFLSLALCTFATTIATRYDISLFLYRMLSSLLTGCIVYFFLRIKSRFSTDNKIHLYGIEGVVVSVMFVLFLTTLCDIQLYTINFGRMTGVLLTYIFAKKYRISGGGICAAVTVFATLLCSPTLSENTLVLCACGIIAGVVAGIGKIAMSIGYIITALFGLVVAGFNIDTFLIITDIAVATVVFLLIPDENENRLLNVFALRKPSSKSVCSTISNRIKFASSSLGHVGSRIRNISNEIEKFKHTDKYADCENSRQLRELLCEQLLITKNLLDDISKDSMKLDNSDAELTLKVKNVFLKYNIPIKSIVVYYDVNNNLYIEVYKQGKINIDMIRLTVDLSYEVDCELSMPESVFIDGITKLTFSKAPLFKVVTGSSQLSASDNDFCGDTVEKIWISSSQYMIILSDGMGTGKRAKLDSSFTTDLVTRFTACGISPVTAISFINSILRVKGWDESFATVDIALFDICNGNVRFIKSGAFASYIIRDGSIIKIESKTFPLGILNDIKPSENEYKIFDDDYIIIASDGVNEKSIRKAFEEHMKSNLTPEQFSNLVCEYVKEYSTDDKRDDISVCVAKIKGL